MKNTGAKRPTVACRHGHRGSDTGPRIIVRDRQNPAIFARPSTYPGTGPNPHFSFCDAPVWREAGGWTWQVTRHELNIPKNIAGVVGVALVQLRGPRELYKFDAPVPGAIETDRIAGAMPVPSRFRHRVIAQQPIKLTNGTPRITDSTVFPGATMFAATVVELEPGGMRELHWHPNADSRDTVSRARHGRVCSPLHTRRAPLTSAPVALAMSRSQWDIRSRIPSYDARPARAGSCPRIAQANTGGFPCS